ncbi:aryl-alcohol dehydrogenase-like predicted oxidoreductase [Neolewinella xylanilytica]|uniref:Aryl-alcohol dehydrogenase-like predicted oxidoreductase n=1 Tax=Neolewinella xylanilytica TaxID=1514080 RepID=A0A2S6I4R9_9BACT|nr:aldo/keto reductase [Neolewinella xylanilytica]PPK86142.1 aryl-alcohol dehydrogenase-like predicted oxidoreductase [Neolewinella xylanilytica]
MDIKNFNATMRYNAFGTTGWQVSKIALGTMTFGQQNTEQEGHRQLDFALERGINIIDTAEMYSIPPRAETQGSTERIIGTWNRARKRRQDFYLATKIAGPGGMADHIRPDMGYAGGQLRSAVNRSLERLQTDYIDLYQLHWPERQANFFGTRGVSALDGWEDNFLTVMQDLQALQREGLIREWGMSNETAWGLMRALHLAEVNDLPRPVSIQNPYSLLARGFEVGLAEVCLRENVAGFPYSPLAMGRLSGKYLRGEADPSSRLNQFTHYTRYNSENSLAATQAYAAIAEKHGLNMSQMALAFVTDRAFTASTIIGATNLEQLTVNIHSISLYLNEEVLKDLEEVQNRFPNPAV